MTTIVIKTVAEIMDDPRLDLGEERIELEVRCGPVYLKCREEVEGPVGEVEVASVHVSKAEVKGGGCNGWCREVDIGG